METSMQNSHQGHYFAMYNKKYSDKMMPNQQYPELRNKQNM